jgi:hypothetical protein
VKQIIIDIAPDGSTKIETKGYTGASCRDGSRFLEEALGVKTGEKLTADFHKAPQTERRLTQ